MSSTNRGKERHRKDRYPTPAWAVHRLLDQEPGFLGSGHGFTFLEPCAGDGAIIQAYWDHPLAMKDVKWSAMEISKRKKTWEKLHATDVHTVAQGDMFTLTGGNFYLLMTNPPFTHAWEMIHHFWTQCRHISLLLRLNFFGSEERHEWMQQHMPDVYILPNRPKFGLNKDGKPGTDSIEYAWFHWDTSRRTRKSGKTFLLDLTPLEERKACESWSK